jgi:N-acetylglucosaminyldiphosphoundecaprenol N-acetyl-beta-D-mannosaminyltransferase
MARVSLFGIEIDAVRMDEALERIFTWIHAPGALCRFVVTPNLDHAVMYQEQAPLRRAYGAASMVLADGMPLLWTARLLRRGLPGRVTGSDLAPALFAAASQRGPIKVFLLGAGPGVAARAAGRIWATWPNVEVVGVYSPPFGFEKNEQENEHILAQIAAVAPDVLIVGLGAPKQELWVHAHRERIRANVALCLGATIDFLAGEKHRGPVWMRKVGLEWLYRLCSEPKRLATRYARDAWIFPRLLLGEVMGARRWKKLAAPSASRMPQSSQ